MVGREYRWYVVYTRAQHEKKLHEDLKRLSVKSYLPLIMTVSFWSDRKKTISRPLFPNYLFVRISNREYLWLAGHPKVIGFVKAGDELSVVRDDVFEAMMRIIEEEHEFSLDKNVTFTPGIPVKVINGSLKGLKGIVTRREGNTFLSVEISPVKQSFLIRIDESNLTPLHGSAGASA